MTHGRAQHRENQRDRRRARSAFWMATLAGGGSTIRGRDDSIRRGIESLVGTAVKRHRRYWRQSEG